MSYKLGTRSLQNLSGVHPDLAAEARQQRNALLAASDWTQVADAPVDQQAWAAHRQQLRDLPETVTDFENIVWPQQPQT